MAFFSEKDARMILMNCGYKDDTDIKSYKVFGASDKMLGFLAEYWKMEIVIDDDGRKILSFFIKAVPKSNPAKADFVKDLNLFEKEYHFYGTIKKCLDVPGLEPWSPKLITCFDDAVVFQDMNAIGYKLRNKFNRFDTPHTIQALRALARFHASSIIYEERKTKELQKHYTINDEYESYLDECGYRTSDPWFEQCMNGALEALKSYSKYSRNPKVWNKIEESWWNIWSDALRLSNFSKKYRNVICHRDLWNNNLLFHYKSVGNTLEPDSCVLIDFQAVRCQPPAGDVMLLLYCNLEQYFREKNLQFFLNYYHQELSTILSHYGITIDDIISRKEFLISADEQRLWGLIACSCLIQVFWIDDDLVTTIFSDTAQFKKIFWNDKGSFIKRMMEENQNYKDHVLEMFEEIVEKYILPINL